MPPYSRDTIYPEDMPAELTSQTLFCHLPGVQARIDLSNLESLHTVNKISKEMQALASNSPHCIKAG